MSLRRWALILATAGVLAGLVVGAAALVARPGDSQDVVHRLADLEVDHAVQVGATLVLEDRRQSISLLDLESSEVRRGVTLAGAPWYAGRGPVALLTREFGSVVARGHDGTVLWSTPQEASPDARPVVVFEDGTTVLRDCLDQVCIYRAVEVDGGERWSHPAEDGQVESLAWFSQMVDTERPILLPGQLVLLPDPAGEEQESGGREALWVDPATGEGTSIGTGHAVPGDDVVVLLDTTDGACDLTILPGSGGPSVQLPGLCAGVDQPVLWLVGDNAVISGVGETTEILVATGDGTVATAPDGLLNVDSTASGLIGLDESSWLFGTNAEGTMSHRTDSGGLLMSTGREAIVVSHHRQPWNPFARGTMRHTVLDPVTGQTCGEVDTAETYDVVPLPGCRAVLADPGRGETLVVGRP